MEFIKTSLIKARIKDKTLTDVQRLYQESDFAMSFLIEIDTTLQTLAILWCKF